MYRKDETITDGLWQLRTNYKRIKAYSKYTEEGVRPKSPNLPYSNLSEHLIRANARHDDSVFHHTLNVDDIKKLNEKHTPAKNFWINRASDTFSHHLTRGDTYLQPYCFIAKDSYSREPPAQYKSSAYGAYPPWGEVQTGKRTESHYGPEPIERFANIDMYRRPLTNQPGRIVFDYGRPSNGYYLQRFP